MTTLDEAYQHGYREGLSAGRLEAALDAPAGLDAERLARAADRLRLWLIRPSEEDIRYYEMRSDDWALLAAEYEKAE